MFDTIKTAVFTLDTPSFSFDEYRLTPLSNGTLLQTYIMPGGAYDQGDFSSSDGGTHLAGQILDANGKPMGKAFSIQKTTGETSLDHQVAVLKDGGFAVTWDFDGEENARFRIFEENGKARTGEITLGEEDTEYDDETHIIAEDHGGFTIFMEKDTSVLYGRWEQQAFDANGKALNEPVTLDAVTAFRDDANVLMRLTDGQIRFVGTDPHAYNVDGYTYIDGYQRATQSPGLSGKDAREVIPLANNYYAMAGIQEEGSSEPIVLHILQPNPEFPNRDVKITGEITVSEMNYFYYDIQPSMVALPDGGVVVFWTDANEYLWDTEDPRYGTGNNVMAQVYDSDFKAVGGNVVVHDSLDGEQTLMDAVLTDSGQILLAYSDDTENGSSLVGTLFNVTKNGLEAASGGGSTGGSKTITGTGKADKLVGTGKDDVIVGKGGSDVIKGRGGDDEISGGGGKDKILAGGGHDDIRGDKGADTLKGGGGRDTLNGGSGKDKLDGGKGDDVLTGGKGGDVFIFGKGFGSDRITDFSGGGKNGDSIFFKAGGGEAGSFNAFSNHSTDTADGVLYDMGDDGQNTLLIEGLTLSDLRGGWFDFA
ncbi:MAG: calcium-binding protein [Heliomarina sp.]|uniref:calcium-binding protein n=1 Tax=Heliomarina sp. TaxID=2917556 RepID=UPI00405A1EEE